MDNSFAPFMSGIGGALANQGKSPWWMALLAALPHFLVGIFLAVRLSPGIFVWFVIAVLLIAWWRSWPHWSGSWVGYASATSFILILNELIPLLGEAIQERRTLIVPQMGIWLPDTAIWLVWLLASLGGLFLLARRDPLAGLLTILPVAPVFLIYVGETPLFLVAMVAGAVAAAICRMRRLDLALGLVLGFNLLVALPSAYLSLLDAPFAKNLTSRQLIRSVLGSLVLYMLWLAPPLLLVLWQGVKQRHAHP